MKPNNSVNSSKKTLYLTTSPFLVMISIIPGVVTVFVISGVVNVTVSPAA